MSKWYEHLLLNETYNLLTTNTINFVAVLLSLDTPDQLTKISKQNNIQYLDKLKVLYQIGQLLEKLARHKTLLNLIKIITGDKRYVFVLSACDVDHPVEIRMRYSTVIMLLIYIHIYIYVYIYICILLLLYIYIFVYIYRNVHIYIYIFILEGSLLKNLLQRLIWHD